MMNSEARKRSEERASASTAWVESASRVSVHATFDVYQDGEKVLTSHRVLTSATEADAAAMVKDEQRRVLAAVQENSASRWEVVARVAGAVR